MSVPHDERSWLPDAARAVREILERGAALQDRKDSRPTGLQHGIRMCKMIEVGTVHGAKGHRWLGWAQCICVTHNIATLDDMKAITTDAHIAAKLKHPFQPTHVHADGGLYREISPGKVKVHVWDQGAQKHDWVEAVLYTDAEGNRWVRTKDDFAARFTKVEA